jgi:hypothetical protein
MKQVSENTFNTALYLIEQCFYFLKCIYNLKNTLWPIITDFSNVKN